VTLPFAPVAGTVTGAGAAAAVGCAAGATGAVMGVTVTPITLPVIDSLATEPPSAPARRMRCRAPGGTLAMMPARRPTMTYAEYFAFEDKSVERHEFLNGEVFAMSGGTIAHAGLIAGVVLALGNALRERPCRLFSSDLRIRIRATGLTTYPDVSVACGTVEVDAEDPHAIVNPVLIVEVLSDSTEAYDRGEKAAHYRHLPSLREYVLVSQHRPHIEVYRRNEAGRWELYEHGSGQQVELASVGATIAVDNVYRDPLAVGAHAS
jgi:Uma2 family endonuclease